MLVEGGRERDNGRVLVVVGVVCVSYNKAEIFLLLGR